VLLAAVSMLIRKISGALEPAPGAALQLAVTEGDEFFASVSAFLYQMISEDSSSKRTVAFDSVPY
jgi:hypothetical protein